MNKNKIYQFKLDMISVNKRYIDDNYTEVGWSALYKISSTSNYPDENFSLTYTDFDYKGKKNPHFNFLIINSRLGMSDYKVLYEKEVIYKRCERLIKKLGFKAVKYSNEVTDHEGKKIDTEFILNRNSPIERLEEFKDIANDFLQVLNENM